MFIEIFILCRNYGINQVGSNFVKGRFIAMQIGTDFSKENAICKIHPGRFRIVVYLFFHRFIIADFFVFYEGGEIPCPNAADEKQADKPDDEEKQDDVPNDAISYPACPL